jgi:hypothetical protein
LAMVNSLVAQACRDSRFVRRSPFCPSARRPGGLRITLSSIVSSLWTRVSSDDSWRNSSRRIMLKSLRSCGRSPSMADSCMGGGNRRRGQQPPVRGRALRCRLAPWPDRRGPLYRLRTRVRTPWKPSRTRHPDARVSMWTFLGPGADSILKTLIRGVCVLDRTGTVRDPPQVVTTQPDGPR